MNDLLSQSFEKARGQPSREEDIESGIGFSPNASDTGIFPDMGMENFFKKVKEIETQMDKITTQIHKLQAANEESNSVTKASAMKAIKERMEISIDEVGKIALKVKLALEEIDRENFSNRQKPGCGKGSGIDRSRTAMTVALKKKLKERMYDFQALRQKIQNEYREVIERRVFTVTGTQADEETIDRLIESGNSEQIFEKAIQGHGRGQVMDTLAEIQQRFDTVKEIEKKLLDLQQMFLDMSVLVEAQGDLLDNIETQVSSAVDHVQTATTVLRKAKKKQRNTRKYTCFAVALFLLIIILLVVPLSVRLKDLSPWSNHSNPNPNPTPTPNPNPHP